MAGCSMRRPHEGQAGAAGDTLRQPAPEQLGKERRLLEVPLVKGAVSAVSYEHVRSTAFCSRCSHQAALRRRQLAGWLRLMPCSSRRYLAHLPCTAAAGGALMQPCTSTW